MIDRATPKDAPQASRLLAWSSAMFAATVCSGLAALPASLRVAGASSGEVSLAAAWALCSALLAIPLLVAVVALRAASSGLRVFGTQDDGLRARAIAATAWVLSLTVALSKLGAVMRAKTHHHALAGATFALVALALAIGLAIAATRLARLIGEDRTRLSIATAVLAVATIAVAIHLKKGLSLADATTRGSVVDVIAFAIAALLGAAAPPLPKVLARGGPVFFLLLLLAGLRAESSSPDLAKRVSEQAPMLGAAFSASRK